MQKFSKWNKGYRYLLNIIDVFSKFAWSIPIKNKTGNTITESFDDVIKKSKRKPKFIWVDQGSEFYYKTFKDWLKKNNIEMYSTFNEGKAVVIERFNRTLKSKCGNNLQLKIQHNI